jgi:hypothetical protein
VLLDPLLHDHTLHCSRGEDARPDVNVKDET